MKDIYGKSLNDMPALNMIGLVLSEFAKIERLRNSLTARWSVWEKFQNTVTHVG